MTTTPPTKSSFPFGATTAVSAKASHSNGLRLSCTFNVKVRPDTKAPKLKCPLDIKQKDPIANYEASASDNDIFHIVEISYDKAPNS